MMTAVLDRVADHVDSLEAQPAHDLEDHVAVARSLAAPMPEHGASLDAVLTTLFDRAVPTSFNTAGPGYLAYIPGGGLLHAAVADFVADAVNRYTGLWLAAPGLVQLEANVLRWLIGMVAYPTTALGILTSGGSSPILGHRRRAVGAPAERFSTVRSTSRPGPSLGRRLPDWRGSRRTPRVIPSDRQFRMRLDHLEATVRRDRDDGRLPFLVVGAAAPPTRAPWTTFPPWPTSPSGTSPGPRTRRTAAFLRSPQRGGARCRVGTRRLDHADPTKACSSPRHRRPAGARRGHSCGGRTHRGRLSPAMQDADDFVDHCQISPELSRPFRGLRPWLPLQLGARSARPSTRSSIRRAPPRGAAPDTGRGDRRGAGASTAVLRAVWPTCAGETNARNRWLMDDVNRRRRVPDGHHRDGQFLLRICVLSFRTHRDRIEQGLADIRAALEHVTGCRAAVGEATPRAL
jgi:aromatic-L-amino-acid decarboxylase